MTKLFILRTAKIGTFIHRPAGALQIAYVEWLRCAICALILRDAAKSANFSRAKYNYFVFSGSSIWNPS